MKNLIKKIIPSFLIDWYHFSLALMGAILYRFPSKKIQIIGVTGTNGKSTVVKMTTKIFEEAGFKVASISSMELKIGHEEELNTLKMTMPGRLKLQRFLRRAINQGCKYAVIEVTSEGIKQHRHRFIDFDVALFTNLTSEHIESHGSFEKYRRAKGELFQRTKGIHIINLDDKNAEYFLQFPSDKKISFTISKSGEPSSAIRAENIQVFPSGLKFSVVDELRLSSRFAAARVKEEEFKLKLLGKFNIYNALAAICIALSQGIGLETSKKALEKIKRIPGRMEIVISEPFRVIVDYAHTPDALEKVYETLLNSKIQIPNVPSRRVEGVLESKMICVLGACGGGRDKWKRPELGKIAAKDCNQIILTNEDPYDENPWRIIDAIERGVLQFKTQKPSFLWKRRSRRGQSPLRPPKLKAVYKVLDRRNAIKKALSLARPNDTVIITGKGSEPWMCLARGKKMVWDDRQVVKEEMGKL